VVGFKRSTPFLARGSDLTQETYCSTVISNIASAFERSIATPVTYMYGRTHGFIVKIGRFPSSDELQWGDPSRERGPGGPSGRI
jgi:hypothetical protein